MTKTVLKHCIENKFLRNSYKHNYPGKILSWITDYPKFYLQCNNPSLYLSDNYLFSFQAS